ncbi:MAG TPA: hypothetical protein VHH36_09725, partial [Candidatus Thermoplasmatota archaeon]|nr:hypothetical protein [Candidatus Thermoplasmatota archaeon]
MMHAIYESPYGRVGSIDVGDLVFVRAVDGPEDVELWVDGGPDRYGRPGDVIAYAPDGNRPVDDGLPTNITVLHRAITWIETTQTPDRRYQYEMRWIDGQVLRFGPEGVYFPPLGFDERNGFTKTNGYRPHYSGFVTKGDNAFTNPAADQALGISQLVHPTWLEGEVYGEVPWMGLGKLALQMGRTNPDFPGWERVGNAFAPVELWTMFFLVVAVVILVPFAVGTWRTVRDARRERREWEAAEAERIAYEARLREIEAQERATRPPPASRKAATFTPVRRG